MTERRVWIDSWQMQCCGDPFALDSRVTWATVPVTGSAGLPEFLPEDVAESIAVAYEHHSPDQQDLDTLSGVVRSIDAVFCRYLVVDRSATPIERSGVLEPRTSVDGREDEDELGVGRTFVGYLVALEAE